MKADKLIEDANELLMQLRIKSEKERINEKQLYDVQMLLYKALDKLRQPLVVGQSEQLLAFAKFIDKDLIDNVAPNEIVERFLSEQLPCKHEHIESSDGCDECMDCGARNY